MEKGLTQLQEVANDVVDKDYTGPEMSFIPDKVQAFTHPSALAARGSVEEVVQRNLKLILGAQFTEKEAENLIARAYDEKLPPEENKKRLDRLILSMRKAAEAKEEASKYFEREGTLKGWEGRVQTISDINKGIEGGSSAPDGVSPELWGVMTPEEKATFQ